jgi:signal transduction histidine kinase
MTHPVEKAIGEDAGLIQAERLSAILQMVNGLAHESRNALQRAQSCLDLLELGLGDDEEQRRIAARIRLALSDLHQNYEGVKEYASPIVLTKSRTDLRQLCQTVFDELTGSLVKSHASLSFASGPPCGNAMVDPARMRIVFRNLFGNSIAAGGNDAEIDIRCQEAVLRDQPAIEMHIRDYGGGMDPSMESRLFEPFATTKQHGTGLGLAVCHRVITAHGGEISAVNHADGGLDVKILLPT